jgi:hypothetical protein
MYCLSHVIDNSRELLEAMQKINEALVVPLLIVQPKALSRTDFHGMGVAFRQEKLGYTFIPLRIQALCRRLIAW